MSGRRPPHRRRAPRRRARCARTRRRRADRLRAVPAADRLQDRPEHPQRARARDALAAARSRIVAVIAGATLPACAGDRAVARAPRARSRAASTRATALRDTISRWVDAVRDRLRGRLSDRSSLLLAGRRARLKWIDNFGIQILIYVMLGWGLNIVVGLAGLLDLGYVAFYAVGAYSYALLAQDLRPVVLDSAAARRLPRGVLGHPARLSGAAAARRLSRDRHARLRRDHPPRADQLGRRSPTAMPASAAFRARPSSAFRSTPATTASRRRSGSNSRPIYRTSFSTTSSSRSRCSPPSSPCGCAGCRSGAPGRRCARTRSPAARSASTPPTPSSRPSRSARCSRGFAGSFFAARQGFISPEMLHLPGIGDDPRHRRARRHGQPDRRRDRRRRHDRRHRDHARARFPQGRSSATTSIRPNTACCCSASPWC